MRGDRHRARVAWTRARDRGRARHDIANGLVERDLAQRSLRERIVDGVEIEDVNPRRLRTDRREQRLVRWAGILARGKQDDPVERLVQRHRAKLRGLGIDHDDLARVRRRREDVALAVRVVVDRDVGRAATGTELREVRRNRWCRARLRIGRGHGGRRVHDRCGRRGSPCAREHDLARDQQGAEFEAHADLASRRVFASRIVSCFADR